MTSNILVSFYEASGVDREGEVADVELTTFRGNHNAKLKKVSTMHFLCYSFYYFIHAPLCLITAHHYMQQRAPTKRGGWPRGQVE